MDVSNELREILVQINNEIAPQDRVSEQEIADVGAELNKMLATATREAGGQLHTPANPRTLKGKLAALWQAIKHKIAAWLSPITPRWLRFVNALKAKLRQLESMPGDETLKVIGLMAIAIAIVAVLIKSMPLLIALLALLGFVSVLRIAERITRIPEVF